MRKRKRDDDEDDEPRGKRANRGGDEDDEVLSDGGIVPPVERIPPPVGGNLALAKQPDDGPATTMMERGVVTPSTPSNNMMKPDEVKNELSIDNRRQELQTENPEGSTMEHREGFALHPSEPIARKDELDVLSDLVSQCRIED